MLGDIRGSVGVFGVAEVDGESDAIGELSSARTTIAGVPLALKDLFVCPISWKGCL